MANTVKTILASWFAVIVPFVALAQGNVSKLCEIIGNITNLVGVFGTIVLIVAFVILLYAAFLFITGGGSPEMITKARTYLIFALVGLAVALLAIFADDILRQLFGGTFLEGCTQNTPFE